MLMDPTGHSFILAMLIGIGIGMVSGAGISFYEAKHAGLSWGKSALAALGGGLLGGAFGAAMVLGGAAGLAATGAIVEGFTLSTGAALTIASGVTAVASLANYVTDSFAYDKPMNGFDATMSFIKGGFQGAVTFYMGYLGGKNHMFDKMVNKNMVDIHTALTIESKSSLFSRILLGSETLFGPTITKSAFFSGSAWLIRKIIEWML